MNPWHDVELGDKIPDLFPAIIEVPKGSKVKYELDIFSIAIKNSSKFISYCLYTLFLNISRISFYGILVFF